MAALSLQQRREAERLQQRGMTLREIARSIGATYEQVCLSLFGGIHDWEPRIGEPVVMEEVTYRHVRDALPPAETQLLRQHLQAAAKPLPAGPTPGVEDINYKEVNDDRNGDASGAGGIVRREHGPGPLPAPSPAEPIPEPPRAAVRPVPEPRPAPPAPEPDAAPVAPAEPPRPQVPHAHPAPVAEPAPAAQPQAPEPPQLYRLSNELGEFLHESGFGMTRNPRLAWSGTAQQMEAAIKRKPHLAQLDVVRAI